MHDENLIGCATQKFRIFVSLMQLANYMLMPKTLYNIMNQQEIAHVFKSIFISNLFYPVFVFAVDDETPFSPPSKSKE